MKEIDEEENDDDISVYHKLLDGKNVFNEDFYKIYYIYEVAIKKKVKQPTEKIRKLFLSTWDEIRIFLREKEDEFMALGSIVNLLIHPILSNWEFRKKHYKDYNINIEFFNNLRLYNSRDNYLYIVNYNFKNEKLQSFIVKSSAGIRYHYDNNYEMTGIQFVDDKEILKINYEEKNETKQIIETKKTS